MKEMIIKPLKTVSRLTAIVLLLVLFLQASCSKEDTNEDTSEEVRALPGTIYFYFAGKAGYYNFATGQFNDEFMRMGTASSSFDWFDISWDKQKIFLTLDVDGTFNFDERRFVLRPFSEGITKSGLSDGKNESDATFEWSESLGSVDGHISPDNRYVALEAQHFSNMPIVIARVSDGSIIRTWSATGVSYLEYGKPIWTNDNTVYFRIGNALYKSSASDNFSTAPLVLRLAEGTTYAVVNPQGTKVVFRHSKHLWMCDIDGNNLVQITTSVTSDIISYDGESMPVFSPDGNYLALTADNLRGAAWSDHNYSDGSWVSATGGKYGYISVIPADGKLYDMDNPNGGAIFLRIPNTSYGIPIGTTPIWR